MAKFSVLFYSRYDLKKKGVRSLQNFFMWLDIIVGAVIKGNSKIVDGIVPQ